MLLLIDVFSIKEPYLARRAINCPGGYSAINDAGTCEKASKSLNLNYLVNNDSDASTSGTCAWCYGWGCNPKGVRVYQKRSIFTSELICQMKGKYIHQARL